MLVAPKLASSSGIYQWWHGGIFTSPGGSGKSYSSRDLKILYEKSSKGRELTSEGWVQAMELEYLVVMTHWLKKQKVRLLEEGPLFEFMKSLSHSVTLRVPFS